MDYTITLHNKRIWEFYNENKNLNIENMNILFIEILEKMYQGINPVIDTNIIAQMLDGVKSLQNQVNNINEKFTSLQSDTSNTFSLKFNEFKREYMENIKMILSTNTNDKIEQIIEKNNDILQDKTKLFLSDIIPRSQETITKELQTIMRELQTKITQDTNTLLKTSINKDTLDNFISSIDGKFSKTLIDSQSIFNSIITSTEQRINTKIGDTEKKILEIKDMTTLNNTSSTQLQNNLTELLKKMENSSSKGKISENILYNVILGLFPTGNIDHVGATKETGDIILSRKDKPIILLENKNYERNVIQDEINKFYRDTELQNANGILLSQKTGIVNKNNYEIEIRNNNILVFMHNVEYDADKIKVAVDIIDYLYEVLNRVNSDETDDIVIDKALLDDINTEFREFTNNKLNHIKTIKDYSQKLLLETENMKLPNMESYLSKKYEISLSNNDVCIYCNYIAKNPRALSAHLRGCKANTTNKIVQQSTQNIQIPLQSNIQLGQNIKLKK